MPSYSAPMRDIHFVLKDLLNAPAHYAGLSGCEAPNEELMDAILAEGAKFAENVLDPIAATGDEQGCQFENGKVTTPPGFKEAFKQWAEGGWQSFAVPVADGGQGLPSSLGTVIGEMTGAPCWAFSMYTGLALAPVTCLLNGGSEAQKQRYLPKLISGEWAGAMCLTEAHCGSDVGLLRTKATPNGDGTYTLQGTKIFISGGEQDLTENIVHAILARVEGAPEGTKGVSLFIAPKYWVEEDGSLGEFNNISCGAVEKKMGLKAQATCVMNYDGARAVLLGEENRGLEVMFKLMNTARLGTALQGLAMSEIAYQGAVGYARERLQMRSLTGPKNPNGPADPIIVHPDVRRMLMTQKAIVEGQRAMIYWLAQQVDLSSHGNAEQKENADQLLELLTPIAKAFCTETAQESVYLGMQVFGGHGYIAEHGMERIARDNRISTVYEGTTGIQALDLLGRKVMGSGGTVLRHFTKQIHKFCESHKAREDMQEFITPLKDLNAQWGEVTMAVGEKAMSNADEVGAASVDYLMFSGYITFAYLWAKMAELALDKAAEGNTDPLYGSKLKTARFYFQRLLPRTAAHKAAMLAGAESMMAMGEDEFMF
ncbi:acyl-CoA dehydrogenase C-terminal domain-containing protein [Spongiibacter sp. KMU-158]|uniref:3-methylmercaptopropionyl-CoA dehydrogenase n=1 Tax=Spongiibacter pelagi TaxID=2760804 RepID=A0A927GY21_9GAMM|nr:acyl-CoA dehydrogenase C-terminal domain-containing protein [Spongiibacter pelagi]MBD2859999.1 acyl-CoA dehydrogenase C-terminal domain-containing protein [Spongiibacter pelagi]